VPTSRGLLLVATLPLLLAPLACTTTQADPMARHQPSLEAAGTIDDRFHATWYDDPNTWRKNTWLGLPAKQNPMDAWITQEIIMEVRPDYFVECGSFRGGSAALWAMVLEQANPRGRVISIDINDRMQEARKLPLVRRRVQFIVGGSTDPEVVEQVRRRVQGKKVVVLLDSLHLKHHVLEELRAYAPLVSPGSYIIVQDTNVNGHPILPGFDQGRGGPGEAVQEFLKENADFAPDPERERMRFTFCPGGYLKRRG
jgi:cephalosporin hydroxylase